MTNLAILNLFLNWGNVPKLLGSKLIRLLTVADTLSMTGMSTSAKSVIFSKTTAAIVTSWLDKETGFLVSENKLAAISSTFSLLIVILAYSVKVVVWFVSCFNWQGCQVMFCHEAVPLKTSHTAVANGNPVVEQDKSDVTEPASDRGRVTVTFSGLTWVNFSHCSTGNSKSGT